jgi:hypothetical protein
VTDPVPLTINRAEALIDFYQMQHHADDLRATAAAIAAPAAAARIALETALQEIADAHLPDQPSAHGGSEYDWAVRHISRLRGIALGALAAPEVQS